MLVPDCHMQTVFLKDLVSAVAPTNPYSFVNYLVKHKSSIASLQADYVQYPVKSFLTTSAGLLKIWITCISVIPLKTLISIKTSIVSGANQPGEYFARNICLGTGKQPYLPPCVKHMTQLVSMPVKWIRRPDLSGKRITVVGGGQSGADLFLNALRGNGEKRRK